MDELGDGYDGYFTKSSSGTMIASPSSSAAGGNAAAGPPPPHPTTNNSAQPQLQLHQSRYVGYPSTSHAFTVKRETSPAVSENSMRSRESYSMEVSMQDAAAVTSPGPSSVSISNSGQPPRPPGGHHHSNFSTDVNQMPDTPPRRRGHRRSQSEIAFRLPDDASFERELGVRSSEMPTLSDEGGEDLFSMYIDMEQINSFSATSNQTPSSKSAGDVPPAVSHHSRSLSMDGGLGGPNGTSRGGGGGLGGGGGYNFTETQTHRPRHQHSSSMDGSTSFKHDMLSSDYEGADTKKVMATAKLADIALIDPKRAKRILANRQSAARSKERKMRYISELERKVQGMQTEATTLSAQLAMLQKDTSSLSTENSELKLRLQSMEQQAHLRDALNDALREEVQRLKLATGQLSNGSGHNRSLSAEQLFQSLNPQQLQQLQQAHTSLNNQQQQQQQQQQQHQIHSDFMQRGAYNLSSNFMKAEGSSMSGNHGSSAAFS